MENPELFYIDPDDYPDETLQPDLVSNMEEEEVTALLLEAMGQIDAYVGDGWLKYDEDQEFVFPREGDVDEGDEPFIARNVQTATRLVADAVLLRRRGKLLPHMVTSDTRLGRSVTLRGTAQADRGFEHWPPEVFPLLDRYRQFGGELVAPW